MRGFEGGAKLEGCSPSDLEERLGDRASQRSGEDAELLEHARPRLLCCGPTATVPKVVRDALGIKEGDEVVFRVEGYRAVMAESGSACRCRANQVAVSARNRAAAAASGTGGISSRAARSSR